MSRPSGRVFSGPDCCTAGPGYESGRRYGCLKVFRVFAAGVRGTLNSFQAESPPVRLVEERWEPCEPTGSLNWLGKEQNHTVTCMVFKSYG
ncbi:hypothetical protein TNCV_1909291 [Trichonephila clavipes]|nr:hypothetical protein TNCV_1909291 [Trichonephila clavipes]